jgi:hypothetical protein
MRPLVQVVGDDAQGDEGGKEEEAAEGFHGV